MEFSKYIKKIRESNQLTQQEMLELLAQSDSSFDKLDLTTLSRWERGVTIPKLEKRLIIARLFSYDVATLIDPYVEIPKDKSLLLKKVLHRPVNPYVFKEDKFNLTKFDSLINNNELCKLLSIFHQSHLDVELRASIFSKIAVKMDAYLSNDEELLGHLLYGYIPADTSIDALDLNKLENCPFIDDISCIDADIALYVVSGYSSLSIPRTITMLTVLDILRKRTNIKKVYINCHAQEGFDMYEKNFKPEVIGKGKELLFYGVKYLNRYYRYIQLSMNPETVLSAKVVSNMVPFTDEHLKELLDES